MLKKSLILVAILFLATTVVLFVHLQALGAEKNVDLEHHEEGLESSQVINTHPTAMEESAHNTPTQIRSPPESINQNLSTTENIHKASLDDVHVFYYPWYANVETDKKWNHWDHHMLPHWNEQTRKMVCIF
jgi:hypothetical protein